MKKGFLEFCITNKAYIIKSFEFTLDLLQNIYNPGYRKAIYICNNVFTGLCMKILYMDYTIFKQEEFQMYKEDRVSFMNHLADFIMDEFMPSQTMFPEIYQGKHFNDDYVWWTAHSDYVKEKIYPYAPLRDDIIGALCGNYQLLDDPKIKEEYDAVINEKIKYVKAVIETIKNNYFEKQLELCSQKSNKQ